MEHALGMGRGHNVSQQVLDGIIMLLDPDMVLLRPLRHDFTHEEVLWVEQNPVSKVVRHGYQIAQQDAYLGNAWMHLNWTHVTGLPKGKFLEPPLESKHDGPRIWNSGPPYLATVQDMYRIAQRWTDYSPRVLDIDSSIYAGTNDSLCWTACISAFMCLTLRTIPLPSRNVWIYNSVVPVTTPSHTDQVDCGLGNGNSEARGLEIH